MGAAIVSPIVREHDDASWNRHPPHLFLFEHGPFGKPVPTFPGHTLEAFHIAVVRAPAQTAFGRPARVPAQPNHLRTATLFAPAQQKKPRMMPGLLISREEDSAEINTSRS